MAVEQHDERFGTYGLSWITIASVALVSIIYFTDVFLKASQKCFWFDELFTVYLCRLPSFKDTWAAVSHGADFNPPLFYLLTRGAQRLFGEGLIATRLPAILGVWLFGVCLFLFVARRTNVISGFIAGTFPFFTLAQYYAYEARAHGLVLGWCGLALVCWQRNAEGRAKNLWLAGFTLCLVGALLTHVYAVYLLFPFALVELYNLFHRGRPDWGIVAALMLALISVTVLVYLPLFRMYRATMPATFFSASHDLLQRFLINVTGPALGVLLLSLALFALGRTRHAQSEMAIAPIPQKEIVVAAGLACIPLLGLLGSKVSHGPFIDRYFLSSIAGYAIFLGFASSRRQVGSWTAQALAGCMLLLMIGDLGSTIYLSMKHRIVLLEPSTGLALSTTPSNPMALYGTLLLDNSGLDILVLPSLEYIYLFKYAPPSMVSHLYYVSAPNDVNLGGYERLAKWARIDLKTTMFGPFLATHNRFLVYERGNDGYLEAVEAFASAGYRLNSARGDVGGIMYEYVK
jgi:hypothetical protein